MANVHLRRIDCSHTNASQQLAELRGQLSSHAEVISEKGRQLTLKVFGEALPPSKVVERVCQDVRQRGLAALLHYTEQFDQVRLEARTLRVTEDELTEAHRSASPDFLQTIRRVRQNILSFQAGLVHSDAILSVA